MKQFIKTISDSFQIKNVMLNNTMPAIHSKIRHEFSNCTGTQLHSGDFSCVVITFLLILQIVEVDNQLMTKITLKTFWNIKDVEGHNFAGLITLTKNVQKIFQSHFCDQWSISFSLKSFYQIPLTWSKYYCCSA